MKNGNEFCVVSEISSLHLLLLFSYLLANEIR